MLSSARRISPAAAGFFQQVEDIRQSLMSFSVKCGVPRSDERREYFAPPCFCGNCAAILFGATALHRFLHPRRCRLCRSWFSFLHPASRASAGTNLQSVRLHQRKKFAPTEAHRRWCRAVVLWTAGATAEKEAACIVTLRRAGLHALAFCRRGYQRGVPFGASLATFCASRKSPAPESGTPLFPPPAKA